MLGTVCDVFVHFFLTIKNQTKKILLYFIVFKNIQCYVYFSFKATKILRYINRVSKAPFSNMVDPKRVVSYEDMLKVIQQPEKVIIDVRNPEEVKSTGKIPSSINIPCKNGISNVANTLLYQLLKHVVLIFFKINNSFKVYL